MRQIASRDAGDRLGMADLVVAGRMGLRKIELGLRVLGVIFLYFFL